MRKLKISLKLILLGLIVIPTLSFIGKKEIKSIDKDFVKISESKMYVGEDTNATNILDAKRLAHIYCSKYEVTNSNYRRFLTYLKKNNLELYNKCIYDSTKWITFYPYSYNQALERDYHNHPAYNEYPIVNIDYNSAVEYCKWLTSEYNATKKRTYKKVKFRLPAEKEWIVASKCLPDGKLPWYGEKGYNTELEYMCNIKFTVIDEKGSGPHYSADNALFMTSAGNYPSNSLGLYDIIGNVAEMTFEKGKAKGGSWNSFISECYIDQTQKYEGRNPEVGFRLFMEIIEE